MIKKNSLHKNKKYLQNQITESKNNEKSSLTNLMILSLLLILIHFIMVFMTNNTHAKGYNIFSRVWGFDNISFFPWQIILLAYIVAIMVCIPFLNKGMRDILIRLSNYNWRHFFKKYKYILFVLAAIISVYIFFSFKIKYHFLGDMDIRVKQSVAGVYESNEYFVMFFLHFLYKFLNTYWTFTGLQTFVLQSVIAGGLFVFFTLLIADLLGRNLFEKLFILFFNLSFGTILFFFGYVEDYSIPGLSFVIFNYFMLLWVRNKINFIIPFLIIVIATALHLLAVGLIPAFVIVFYRKNHLKFPVFKNIKIKPFIILILCLLPVAYFIGGKLTMLTPLSSPEKNPNVMTLFSYKHLWEYLNSQILASGVGFFILLFLTIRAIRKKIKLDNTLWYFAAATFFMLFLTFISNTERGSGDWDICAFPSLIYMPMVAYFLIFSVNTKTQLNKLKYAAVILVVFNFLNSTGWVAINASDKSIKKIASMLENDPGYYYTTKLSGLANLAYSYQANGLIEESLNYFKKEYLKNNKDPVAHLRYANALWGNKKQEEAVQIYEGVINMAPYIESAYGPVINFYQENKKYTEIYRIIDNLFTNYNTNPQMFLSNFKKDELLQYFNYLYSVELNNKNIIKAQKIQNSIQEIKNTK
jgi:tetratricopeptide (TPR) repeat protein